MVRCYFEDIECVFDSTPTEPGWCRACTNIRYRSTMNEMNTVNKTQALFMIWTQLQQDHEYHEAIGKKVRELLNKLSKD